MQKINLTDNSWITIYENFYKLNDNQYNELWNLKPNEASEVIIYGKRIKVPRLDDLFGNSEYTFSGITRQPRKLDNPILIDILDKINKLDGKYQYNGIFVNWYENEKNYIGYHSDDERDLVKLAPIYSLSFGESRNFKLKNNETKEVYDFLLKDGMLLVMGGACQKEFKHSIPKTTQPKKSRINLTMRSFN